MSYYCDYVVGNYQNGITQTVLAAISGIPMGIGVIVIQMSIEANIFFYRH